MTDENKFIEQVESMSHDELKELALKMLMRRETERLRKIRHRERQKQMNKGGKDEI
ncbi:MAG: hypothetical protein ACRC18_06890 [Cetobacterium sp.]